MSDLWRSVAAVSAGRVYSLLGSAAMIMIVARWLGPSGQGVVAAATAWATLFATMGALSLGQVAMHRATVRRHDPWLADTMGTLLAFAAAVTVLAWLGAALLYAATGGRTFGSTPPPALAVGLLLVPFLIWELYGGNLLIAIDRIDVYNRAQVVGRTVGLVLMAVCWWMRLGVKAALLVAVVSQASISCIGVRELWRAAGSRVRATAGEARALLGGAAQLHVNTVTGYVYLSLGILVVNRFCSAADTGLYQFAMSLMNVILVIPLAASSVLSSRVVMLGPDAAWPAHRRALLYMSLLMIATAAVAAILAPRAVAIVVGARYAPAVPLFRWSLLAVVGMTFSAIMASQWIGRGYFWQMSATSIVVAIVHLTAMWALVRRYGVYGAVYANLITSGMAIVGNGVFALFCEMRLRAAPSQGEGTSIAVPDGA